MHNMLDFTVGKQIIAYVNNKVSLTYLTHIQSVTSECEKLWDKEEK